MLTEIRVKSLGLAAYVKMSGISLKRRENDAFVFDSSKSVSEWELEYSNSCCRRHDSELMNLRKFIR